MRKKITYPLVILLFIVLCFGVLRIIDLIYLRGMSSDVKINTTLTSGEILAYYGVILSGLIMLAVMYFSFKNQQRIFKEETNREKINRKIEKRSLLSIDEQFLTGYKLDKYNFSNMSILHVNESYIFIRDNDIKIPASLNNEKVEVNCLDHKDFRYLVISNTGEYPLFSLNIKINTCMNADDNSNRTLMLEQNLTQSTLIAGGSLYIIVGGALETIKFAEFYDLGGEKDDGLRIRIYIPLVEINCTTVAGEKLLIKTVRETLEKNEYVTEIKSDITDEVIKYSTYEHETQYIGCSALKSEELEQLADDFILNKLLPRYRCKQ